PQMPNPSTNYQVGSMHDPSVSRGHDIFASRGDQRLGATTSTPIPIPSDSTRSPTAHEPPPPMGFIPNPTGTYTLDYDWFSDDDSDEEVFPMECEQFPISDSPSSSQGAVNDDSRIGDPSQMSEIAKGKQRATEIE